MENLQKIQRTCKAGALLLATTQSRAYAERGKDLSQLKWIFDGKKVSQKGLTEAMKKAIDDGVIPDAVLEHWGYGLRDGLKYKNEKILPYLDSIFKTE